MDLSSSLSSAIPKSSDKESMVDPFLVEALQNPRHRLTILRMELDLQKFLKNPELQQFEFQQFPTSYLRLAAHRVAQHYGLTTSVQEIIDGQGNRIVVRKATDSRYPAVCLSEIPAKHLESEKSDKVRVVIKPRPSRNSGSADNEAGLKRSPSRTVEDRKEEYDRARARIFSSPGSPVSGDSSVVPMAGKDLGLTRNESEINRNSVNDSDKSYVRDGLTPRVAIIRDIEKDRFDPDYDRSYGRYVRSLPADQSFGLTPFHMEKSQLPYVQYGNGACLSQYGLMPRTQTSVNYGHPSSAVMTPFGAMGVNVGSTDPAPFLPWPNHAMMYAHSYEQFRHAIYQAPFSQHPPSLSYSQNLMNRS
uniref:Single-stranded nucleic acid binding R3H protein n=1 Tax=Kalanchoe fedtschenkoi TaxID=63787 RepID=A0A7N0TVE9_KALFE